MYAAFAHRDEAALLAHVDPAMRVHDRPHHPDASVYEGQDGFLSFAQTDWDAFDEFSYEPQDFIAREAYVIVPITQRWHESGPPPLSARDKRELVIASFVGGPRWRS